MPFAKLFTIAAILALGFSVTSATPFTPTAEHQPGYPHSINNPTPTATTPVYATSTSDKYFRLKTMVRSNQPREATRRFDEAYVWNYHTGAAQADLVIGAPRVFNSSAATGGAIFTLVNGTTLGWEIYYYNSEVSNPDSYVIPVGIPSQSYVGWTSLVVSPGGYNAITSSFNEPTGFLEMKYFTSIPGFRVCDWSHGVPQVFAMVYPDQPSVNGYYNHTISSCADVDLVREFLTFP